MKRKKVLIVGGGVAGLSTGLELANLDVGVELVEKTHFLGGHGIQYACKATDQCVKCGACSVEQKLAHALQNPNIRIHTGSRCRKITKNGRFGIDVESTPRHIDPHLCTACNTCFERCPASDAIIRGHSANNKPLYAICEDHCLYFKDSSCTLCQQICPTGAIKLDNKKKQYALEADAIIVAAGFEPYDPVDKPYGYQKFKNVITNLELEKMLRCKSVAKRPSDDNPPKKIAFIQCVGSRDVKLNHLWCSKVCCASTLRMAALIKMRQPDTEITVFYIDIQTFGKDFRHFYEDIQSEIRMIRAIPGDIFKGTDDGLQVSYFDNRLNKSMEEPFDMVVLAIGLLPLTDTRKLAHMVDIHLAETGFVNASEQIAAAQNSGVFAAGTVQGPLSISETINQAGDTAWQVAKYLGI